ncbi:hypothetical protein BGW36DRAFT_390153 [Talaromyces proteolyticus]|uniref:Uncharacterized protein n=1 Tax=Talaromyces proteolyticus TaxID=1131652 RepID=A0AAD4PV04_9EURO|nr:uncharacterized protein BGW36DRAFT_390153 [Talaromyces proteolyticus]KAH8690056.1 hypothetical protein BGW36DRAFT_390153 [Talaromyces proteolyticus]
MVHKTTSNKSGEHANAIKQPFRFMNLPPELRVQVYLHQSSISQGTPRTPSDHQSLLRCAARSVLKFCLYIMAKTHSTSAWIST